MSNDKLKAALKEYFARKSSRKSLIPLGKIDSHGLWEPDQEERQPCCFSKEKYYTHRLDKRNLYFLEHCTTIKHVAYKFGVGYNDLRKKILVVYRTKRMLMK